MDRRRVMGPVALVVVVGGLASAVFLGYGPDFEDRSMGAPQVACPRLRLSEHRCTAVIDQANKQLGGDVAGLIGVELGRPNGSQVSIGGYLVAVVRFHLPDGSVSDEEVWCRGVGNGPRPWCDE